MDGLHQLNFGESSNVRMVIFGRNVSIHYPDQSDSGRASLIQLVIDQFRVPTKPRIKLIVMAASTLEDPDRVVFSNDIQRVELNIAASAVRVLIEHTANGDSMTILDSPIQLSIRYGCVTTIAKHTIERAAVHSSACLSTAWTGSEWLGQVPCLPTAHGQIIQTQCLFKSQLCDGRGDCPTREDESDLVCVPHLHPSTREHLYRLSSRLGLLSSEDPDSCGQNTYHCAPVEHSTTRPTVCIPTASICDGLFDCPLGDDETDAQCVTMTGSLESNNTSCPTLEYPCPEDDICLPMPLVCDGRLDCSRGMDESDRACQWRARTIFSMIKDNNREHLQAVPDRNKTVPNEAEAPLKTDTIVIDKNITEEKHATGGSIDELSPSVTELTSPSSIVSADPRTTLIPIQYTTQSSTDTWADTTQQAAITELPVTYATQESIISTTGFSPNLTVNDAAVEAHTNSPWVPEVTSALVTEQWTFTESSNATEIVDTKQSTASDQYVSYSTEEIMKNSTKTTTTIASSTTTASTTTTTTATTSSSSWIPSQPATYNVAAKVTVEPELERTQTDALSFISETVTSETLQTVPTVPLDIIRHDNLTVRWKPPIYSDNQTGSCTEWAICKGVESLFSNKPISSSSVQVDTSHIWDAQVTASELPEPDSHDQWLVNRLATVFSGDTSTLAIIPLQLNHTEAIWTKTAAVEEQRMVKLPSTDTCQLFWQFATADSVRVRWVSLKHDALCASDLEKLLHQPVRNINFCLAQDVCGALNSEGFLVCSSDRDPRSLLFGHVQATEPCSNGERKLWNYRLTLPIL
ncbi:unnamed protein product [Echinostoma caproni]|uniref:Low-density lipoprotein receptor domain class A n=1 Tax=Echinostoma caproni TaxID=27848 RepID=A0A183A751_9TREM|nr:unnamed protein product [Echinostoma caproni]